ncbi:hypothetical protein CDD80_3413 [Ophiocordyceps camponoti-rufipedis]|uniref:Multicopper oxidase n=1 Tax=Ophiocordyceps camponoti-rufipedis TaxID=2004952 RepID=A0A2C5Z2L7_9HYPO|nr:hypothetical protein CDD80_3413 [Ophiocordyceps camponoti-rufipedis]
MPPTEDAHLLDYRCPRRSLLARVSKWSVLALLALATLLALPLLAYTRRQRHPGFVVGHGDGGQLAIGLHPERHVWREPRVLVFNWTVTKGMRTPDGVEKMVYLVNDLFPGPTIEARSGDRIIVDVANRLENETLALHWHGLQMKGHNAMDGAVGITQCAIQPGRSFVYDFTIGDDEHGTFWWHGHSQLQRGDGLFGGLVVYQPGGERAVEDEVLLLVGDWFHRSQMDVLAWFAHHGSLGNEPVPDSLLVNGRGRFDCHKAVPARPVVCSQQHLDPVFRSRRRTRVRIVNTGSVAGFTLAVEGGWLRAVAVDGGCRTIVLYIKTQTLSRFANKPLGFVNHTSWKPQPQPLLSLNRSRWDENQLVPFIPSTSPPTTVDLIINNLDDGSHPIHLHGYSFHILSSHRERGRDGWGSYNPFETPPSNMNLEDAVVKDTVAVPRRGHVVLRLTAGNPGLWMLHCHMLVHMGTGMVAALHVGGDLRHEGVEAEAAGLCGLAG